jgi:tetratricopeptide (TPR) repeat protein
MRKFYPTILLSLIVAFCNATEANAYVLTLENADIVKAKREIEQVTRSLLATNERSQRVALLFKRAKLYKSVGDSEYMGDLNRMVQTDPSSVQLHIKRALILESTAEWDKALSDYSFAIKHTKSPSPNLYLHKGQVLRGMWRDSEALAVFEQGLKLGTSPDLVLARNCVRFSLGLSNIDPLPRRSGLKIPSPVSLQSKTRQG